MYKYKDELAEAYGVNKLISHTCPGCDIEPPQMRFKCPSCELNNSVKTYYYPSLNCSISDLIKLLSRVFPIVIESNGGFNIYLETGIETIRLSHGETNLENALIKALCNEFILDYVDKKAVQELFK